MFFPSWKETAKIQRGPIGFTWTHLSRLDGYAVDYSNYLKYRINKTHYLFPFHI